MSSITQYELADGSKRWRYQCTVITDSLTGKKKRTTKRGFTTKKQAEIALSRVLTNIDQHGYRENQNITYNEVYEYFMGSYKNTVKESTLNHVISMFKYHILPAFGKYPIKKITAPQCQATVNKWSAELKDYKKIKNYAAKIFKEARRLKIIYDDPMEFVVLPHMKESSLNIVQENFWDREQLQTFFECLIKEYIGKNDKAIAIFRVLAMTGARKAEILALQVSDFDPINKTININKTITRAIDNKQMIGTPKTPAAYRVLSLDDKTVSILKDWIKIMKRNMLILGFNTNKPDQLLFPNTKNKLLSLMKPNSWLNHIIDKYNLKRITVHGIRHTYISMAIESHELTIKQIQHQVGHQNTDTLLNTYAHLSKKAERETVEKFSNYVSI